MPRMHTAAVLPTITTSLGLTALLGGPSMAGDTNRFDVGWSDIDVFFIDFSAGEVPDNVQDVQVGDPGRYFSNIGWSNVDVDVCWNTGSSFSSWASEVAFNIRMSEAGTTQWYIVGSPFSGDDTGSDAEGTCSNRQALAAVDTPLNPFTYAVDASGIVETGMSTTWNDGTGLRHSEVNTADFYFVLGAEIPAGCEGPTGSCGESHPEPGCDDVTCCAAVCEFDPFCCESAWDSSCVDMAISACGIFQYSCDAPAYANDCATDPAPIRNGQTVPFQTIGANTDGPDEIGCGSGSDLPIWSDLWYLIELDTEADLIASCCNMTDFDSKIAIYSAGEAGSDFDPSRLPELFIACNEDCEDSTFFSSEVSVSELPAGQYLIRIGGYQGATGSGELMVSWEEPEPKIPPRSCDDPGPDTVSQTIKGAILQDNGVACAAGGFTVENGFGRVYTAEELGDAFTLDCITFGVYNTGSYVEGDVNVYRMAEGIPSGNILFDQLELLATIPYGCYGPTAGTMDTVVLDGGLDIDLGSGAAILVELFMNASSDGFAAFAGGTSGDVLSGTTWIRSDPCGLNDFYRFATIGFDVEWFVDLNGTIGGEQGCPGDFDDNGIVRSPDLGRLLAAWGDCEGCPEDLDGDGQVNAADLGILVANWGPCS